MKKKRITAIQAYWKGVRCAEHLIRGLKQLLLWKKCLHTAQNRV